MSALAERAAARRSMARGVPPLWTSLRALLRRGLADHRRAVLGWGLGLGAFSALILFTWPSIEDSVGDLVQSYPEGLKEAFGIGELDTVEAFFDAEMLSLIIPLGLGFLAVRTASHSISAAEDRGWLDTLLATPLSREALVAGSLLTTGVVIAAVLVLTTAVALLAGVVSGADPSAAVIGRGMANVWPLAMFFAGIAMLAAGRLHSDGLVSGLATGALVAMYLLDVVGRVADAEPLRWISAFRYYGSAVSDGIDPIAFAGLTLAAIALSALGAILFRRRDVLA